MKRDMDLVRQILLAIEASDSSPDDSFDLQIEGRSAKEVSYHVWLLHGGGLIDAEELSYDDVHDWQPRSLTWKGSEFLDNARDPSIWGKLKARAGSTFGSMSLAVANDVLAELVKKQLLGP